MYLFVGADDHIGPFYNMQIYRRGDVVIAPYISILRLFPIEKSL